MKPNLPPKVHISLPGGEFVDIHSGNSRLIRSIQMAVDREAQQPEGGLEKENRRLRQGGQAEIEAQGAETRVAGHSEGVADLRAFLSRVDVRNVHTEMVTAVVYYYVELRKRPSVTISDLWAAYRQQGWDYMPVFKAVERAARRNKWLMRAGKNVVVLTEEGKGYVDDLLRGIRPVTHRRRGKGQGRGAGEMETLVKRDSLDLLGGNGRESFRTLVERIDVKSARQRVAMCVWYLTRIVRQQTFDEHDVFTMFDHVGWPLPKSVRNSIVNDARYYDLYARTTDGKFRAKDNLVLYVEREIFPDIGAREK